MNCFVCICISVKVHANVKQNVFAATVTVNGTAGGTIYNPIKINVKEDEGVIVLCYLFTFPDGVDTLSGTCQTMDGTASKL